MSADSAPDEGTGGIISGIPAGELPRKTIQFVYDQLPAWRDDPDRPDEQSENPLNLQLCKFLNSRARDDFPMVCFNHEEYQVAQRSVDFSASPSASMTLGAKGYSSIYEPFLVLEGKRLPAPRKNREKEYVTGFSKTSGGIQRFKMGLHGHGQTIAAMIGYIQKDTTTKWYDEINSWIDELATGQTRDQSSWDGSEMLTDFKADKTNHVSRSRSNHSRTGGASTNQIELNHLWVEMNSGTSARTGTISEAKS